jgi:Cd2+/Zn2+-exporting ATPase
VFRWLCDGYDLHPGCAACRRIQRLRAFERFSDSRHGLPERRKRYSQGARWYRGIRSLRFELAARTLTIEGEQLALESGLQAIRQLGFEVLPIEHEQKTEMPSGLGEISKALIALALAIGAEALDFFAPDTLLFKGLGMALAAAAIAFSGFSTYRKGLAALRRGQLNMNALMGVAVTGAFLIGQWPEAAMVMALYAIAELIEARSVDRARNAIKGLLAWPRNRRDSPRRW